MNQSEQYIREVSRHLLASEEDRERFAQDLRAHFAEDAGRGNSASETINRLGSPPEVAASFNAELELRYAGFLRRFSAFLFDFALALVLMIPAAALLALSDGNSNLNGLLFTVAVALSILIVIGFSIFYFPLLEGRFGRTFGKQLMRIRVIDEGGGPAGFGQAFLRRISLWLEILVIDALFIPFTERKQRAFDIVARTVVVEEPARSTPNWAWIVCLFGWLPVSLSILLLLGFVN